MLPDNGSPGSDCFAPVGAGPLAAAVRLGCKPASGTAALAGPRAAKCKNLCSRSLFTSRRRRAIGNISPMQSAMGTTSKMYAARRGTFQYVASWEFAGPALTWTAVVMGPGSSKLIVGQLDVDHPGADVAALVRREVEERIDLQTWLEQ